MIHFFCLTLFQHSFNTLNILTSSNVPYVKENHPPTQLRPSFNIVFFNIVSTQFQCFEYFDAICQRKSSTNPPENHHFNIIEYVKYQRGSSTNPYIVSILGIFSCCQMCYISTKKTLHHLKPTFNY